MKFFHLSDLHIGRQLHFYSLKEEQEAVLKEIIDYAKQIKPEAIVIAGDVYDKSVPSAEAVAVFDGFIREIEKLGIPTLLISGNHDSPERLDFASSLLEKQGLYIGSMPLQKENEHLKKVVFWDKWGEVCFWLLPFMKPAYVREILGEEELSSYTEAVEKVLKREAFDPQIRNVLVTHQFFTASGKEPERCDSETIYVGGSGNVDVAAVQEFDYVAMGHIHKAQQVGGEQFRYCGTPLKYSVSESSDEKTLTVVTLKEKGTFPLIQTMPLHPLRDVKCLRGTLEEVLRKECGDYVSVTLTDEKLPYQPREQLNRVFPYLLEVKIDNTRTKRQLASLEEPELMESPLEMFGRFYKEIHGTDWSNEEQKIVKEILEKLEVDQ